MNQNKYSDDVLLIFIGYACDAQKEVSAVTELKQDLQKHLNHLNRVSPAKYHHTVEFFTWEEDADSGVGGQKKKIDKYLKRADIAIFIFKNRVGKVTWEELEELRNNDQKEIPIIASFPATPSSDFDFNEIEVIEGWEDLLKKKSSLTQDWTGEESCSITPIVSYENTEHLKEIVLEKLQNIISSIESSNKDKHVTPSQKSFIENNRQFIDKSTGKVDYDPSLVRYFRSKLRKAISAETKELDDTEFLEKEGFLRDGSLTIVGALLFTNTPCILIPTAKIKCVRYYGDDKSADRNRDDYKKSLLKQIEESYDFIQLNIEKKEKPIDDDLTSKTVYKFPMVTVREIIANAVSHRDYTNNEKQIHIRIFDNSIEVESPGRWFQKVLPENQNIPLSKLCGGSVKRNTSLADALASIDIMEAEGSGIFTSVKECRELNAPEPIVVEKKGSVFVKIFPIKDWDKIGVDKMIKRNKKPELSKGLILYSHSDMAWTHRLKEHLKVLELEKIFTFWNDTKLRWGENWLTELDKSLETANIAVLLISPNFLTSDIISKKEISSLLERYQNDGLVVIPVLVRPCPWTKVPWLAKIQVFPNDGEPLSKGSEIEIDKKLADLVEIIHDIVIDKTVYLSSSNSSNLTNTTLLTNLPSRNIRFIDRTEELRFLENQLKKTNRVLLVNGLAGIGKTELCKRFFLENYKKFLFAGWIDYIDSIKNSVVSGIRTNLVKPDENDTLDDQFNRMMNFLQNLEPDTLLVIDNINNPDDQYLNRIAALPFKVIANSRLRLEGFETLTLDFLSMESCKSLFYEFYQGERDDEYVEKIVERCGRHTLAVELLAKTAQNAGMPVKSLHENLTAKGFNLNEAIGETVSTFWHNEKQRKQFFNHLLTIFDLSNITDDELHILTNLSVLPSIYISLNDISEWMALETKENINALVRKGWLLRDKLNIFMHQVSQEVVRYKTTPDAEKCENLIIAIGNELYLKPGENPLNKKEYIIFAELLLQYIDEDNKNLATLSNNLSTIYQDMGNLDKSLLFQLKAVKIKENIMDKNHPTLANSYNNLSGIYQDMGQLEQALEFQLKTMGIFENILEKNHPSLAQSYNNLSLIYKDMGHLEQALEFQLKSMEIFENILDKNHPSLATSYNNLSLIYQALSQAEKALEFQTKAVEIREKVLDKKHPDLATSYNNLALVYLDLRNHRSAKEYSEKAVAILEQIFPNGHPNLEAMKRNLDYIKKKI